MGETKHTATPWTNECFQILGPRKERIAHTGMGQRPPSESHESEVNAKFIVRAANAHDDLLAALKEIAYADIDSDEPQESAARMVNIARAAIAKAEGR